MLFVSLILTNFLYANSMNYWERNVEITDYNCGCIDISTQSYLFCVMYLGVVLLEAKILWIFNISLVHHWYSSSLRNDSWSLFIFLVLKIIFLCISVCVHVCVHSATQSCWTLCNPMNCSLPGSSFCGIFQPRILNGVAIPFSRDLPDPGIKPTSPASLILASGFFTTELPGKPVY